jgi:hypothetical protein
VNAWEAARCPIERLMRQLGIQGATRGPRFKATTIAAETATALLSAPTRNVIAGLRYVEWRTA